MYMKDEIAYAEDRQFLVKAKEALGQIEEQKYSQKMRTNGVSAIAKYGVAFSGKQMQVIMEIEEIAEDLEETVETIQEIVVI